MHYKRLRQTLLRDPQQKAAVEAALVTRLAHHLGRHEHHSKPILLYAALPAELDMMGLATVMPQRTFALPRVVGKEMHFHLWSPQSPLVSGQFGIQEPAAETALVDLSAGAIILCPALSFTPSGVRLGYGGGYYDRYINNHNQVSLYKIGVTLEAFVSSSLPVESHDQAMQIVATEARLIFCRQTAPG